jgi:hypothetical protein
MTSLATIIGLMPMALKLGEGRGLRLWPGHLGGLAVSVICTCLSSPPSSSHTGNFSKPWPPELNHLSAKIL